MMKAINDGIALAQGIAIITGCVFDVAAPSERVEGRVAWEARRFGAKDAFECARFCVTEGRQTCGRVRWRSL